MKDQLLQDAQGVLQVAEQWGAFYQGFDYFSDRR